VAVIVLRFGHCAGLPGSYVPRHNVAVGLCFRTMQVVQLDKHIRLLDSPGVVMATKMVDDATVVLRNCIRVSCAVFNVDLLAVYMTQQGVAEWAWAVNGKHCQ